MLLWDMGCGMILGGVNDNVKICKQMDKIANLEVLYVLCWHIVMIYYVGIVVGS